MTRSSSRTRICPGLNDSRSFTEAQTFAEAMRAWQWEVKTDEVGNVVGLRFTGEKAGDDRYLLAAIAPFVSPGSHIDMRGEEPGDFWRWEFDRGQCIERKGRVTY